MDTCTLDSLDMMSVCVQSSCNPTPSVDVANHNSGSPVSPPTSLSLRSSHNQLLSSELMKQGSSTPPKCRKKYALTSIQSAMGLGDAAPSNGTNTPPSATEPASNSKHAKNGANQLRKAAEQQDVNKNTAEGQATGKAELNSADEPELSAAELDSHMDLDSNTLSESLSSEEAADLNTTAEEEEEEEEDRISNASLAESEDLLILPELHKQEDDREDVKKSPTLDRKSQEVTLDKESVDKKTPSEDESSCVQKGGSLLEEEDDNNVAEDQEVTQPLLKQPRPPSLPKQPSCEETPLLSSSSSSSPEVKKDRPRTGAKTDCALNRIQNLAPSDEESSWTTLSQDSASLGSPEENGKHTHTHRHSNTQTHS